MSYLGQIIERRGDVTRLTRIGAKAPALVEKELGYEAGRLAAGYAIGLLAAPIRPSQVEFGGLTLRSGGREGKPLDDPAADRERKRVHDSLAEHVGTGGVETLRKKLADDPGNLVGPDRIVKFFPVTRHVGANPAQEYPMGDGSAQFTLTEPHSFFVAVEVGPDQVARTAEGWSAPIGEAARLDDRTRLARYLATTPASPK